MRYVGKVGLTELCDGLNIQDRRERDVKNDSQLSGGRCSWVDGDLGKETQQKYVWGGGRRE